VKHTLSIALSLLAAGLVFASARDAAAKDRPNVIVVVTDDQGYGDLSCHGNPVLKTPNLDKLRGESIRFTDFHVAPMCTPTRGELMTGMQAFRNGAVFVCQGKSMIRRGIPTAANIFKTGGYATGHFGKWHLGDNCPYRPQDRGFDETVHHGAWGITSMADHWNNDYFDDIYEHNGRRKPYRGYCTDVWFNEAMRWMAEQKKNEHPFFCYLATNVPHWPFTVERRYTEMCKGIPFLGMIAQFDENLGRLEQFLRESGLRENTILIFMTDNGTAAGHRVFNAGMRGHKTSYYEGGHRVPFFLRWPAAGLDKPRDVDQTTHGTDLLPTLIDLCRLKKPRQAKFDGLSLASLIEGKTDKLPDRKLVVQYRDLGRPGAVLWNKWRLVHGRELYNLADDPGQKNNLAEKHPDVAEAMKGHYVQWREEIRPLAQQINTVSIGADAEPVAFLCSANWIGDYADSWHNLRGGGKNGYWDLKVEESGDYTIALYAWPQGADAAFGAKFKAIPGRAVAEAKLKIGETELTKKTSPDAMSVDFTVSLKKGDQARLQSWLYDAKGKDLGGSYFVYVSKRTHPLGGATTK